MGKMKTTLTVFRILQQGTLNNNSAEEKMLHIKLFIIY